MTGTLDTFPLYTRLKHTYPALDPLLATILCFNHLFTPHLKHTYSYLTPFYAMVVCFNAGHDVIIGLTSNLIFRTFVVYERIQD